MMFLWTAFITGLVGSLHCVGMCGPIALALPKGFSGRMALLSSRVLYNFGRVFTYMLLGGALGLLGEGFAMAGFQQGLSIALGVGLLLLALFSLNLESRFLSLPLVERVMARLRRGLGRHLRHPSFPSMLSIGLLNGLLPCGFVYLGLAGAVSMGTALDSMAYMALFGLGTFPLMLATSLLGSLLQQRYRRWIRPLLFAFTVAFALLLILRGMNLGIPYISPVLIPTEAAAPECH